MLHAVRRIRTSRSVCPRPLANARVGRGLLTLAIETSCDDTCVAVLSKEQQNNATRARLLFNERVTCKNTGKGGIVPIDATQSHQAHLSKLVHKALRYLPEPDHDGCPARTISLLDGTPKRKPDFVSVTRGPGSLASLAVGLATAKGLATAWQLPMVGVHHMQAHACTPRLVHLSSSKHEEKRTIGERRDTEPKFPFLTLLVSGGHTMLLHSKGLLDHEILAGTQDNAIGDALDKCGRTLLPASIRESTPDTSYARYLSKYAFRNPDDFASWTVPAKRSDEIEKTPNEFGWKLSTPHSKDRELVFSFASIPSQVDRAIARSKEHGALDDQERLLLARAALGTAFEHLASRTVVALEKLQRSHVKINTLVVSGGVAANDFLRHYLRKFLDARGFGQVELIFPPVELCVDNAAMIAWAGTEMFEAGWTTDLNCAPIRSWSLDSKSPDGGILGVGGWLQSTGQPSG